MERKLRIDSEDSTTASFHKPEQPENPNDARLPVYPHDTVSVILSVQFGQRSRSRRRPFFPPRTVHEKKPGKFFDKIEETVFIYFVHPNINDA